MTNTHQGLLRALVAAQVAVIEHADEDVVSPPVAINALDACLKEAARLARQLRKENQ